MKILESFFYFFLRTMIPTSITIPSDAMVPYTDKLSSRKFAENCIRVIAKSSKALQSSISLKLGLRFIYFKNDLCSLFISFIPFWSKSFIHRIMLFLRKSGLLRSLKFIKFSNNPCNLLDISQHATHFKIS